MQAGMCYLPTLSFYARVLSLAADERVEPYAGKESRLRRFALPMVQAVLAGCLSGLLYTPAAVAFPFFLLLLQAAHPILLTCFGDTSADPPPLVDEPSLPCLVGDTPSPLSDPRTRQQVPTMWAAKELWVAPESISSMEASPRGEEAGVEDGEGQRKGEPESVVPPLPRTSEDDSTMFDNALFELLPLPPINPTKEPRRATSSFANQLTKDECSEPKRVSERQEGESNRDREESGMRAMAESEEARERSVAAIIHQAVQKAVVM